MQWRVERAEWTAREATHQSRVWRKKQNAKALPGRVLMPGVLLGGTFEMAAGAGPKECRLHGSLHDRASFWSARDHDRTRSSAGHYS